MRQINKKKTLSISIIIKNIFNNNNYTVITPPPRPTTTTSNKQCKSPRRPEADIHPPYAKDLSQQRLSLPDSATIYEV